MQAWPGEVSGHHGQRPPPAARGRSALRGETREGFHTDTTIMGHGRKGHRFPSHPVSLQLFVNSSFPWLTHRPDTCNSARGWPRPRQTLLPPDPPRRRCPRGLGRVPAQPQTPCRPTRPTRPLQPRARGLRVTGSQPPGREAVARGGGTAPDSPHTSAGVSHQWKQSGRTPYRKRRTRPHLKSICSLPSKLKEFRMKTFHTGNKHTHTATIGAFSGDMSQESHRSGACSSLCSGSPSRMRHAVWEVGQRGAPGAGLGSFRVGAGATVR